VEVRFTFAETSNEANDCNTLKDDGILKICTGRQQSISTPPTICRLENHPGKRELYQMAKAFINDIIASYETASKVIIIDCDETNSYTYGKQELALFNTYYRDSCYMSLHIY